MSDISVYEYNRLKLKSIGYEILKEKMGLMSKLTELDQKEAVLISQLKVIDEAEQKNKEQIQEQPQIQPTTVSMNVDPITSEVIPSKEVKKSIGPTVKKSGE